MALKRNSKRVDDGDRFLVSIGAMMRQWVIGLAVSVIAGGIFTWLFLKGLRWQFDVPSNQPKGIPSWLTGVVERIFFTVIIGLGVQDVPTTMIAWLGVKLAANWNHPDWQDKPNARTFAFAALLAGLVSMLFAFIGGLICAGKLWLGRFY